MRDKILILFFCAHLCLLVSGNPKIQEARADDRCGYEVNEFLGQTKRESLF